MSKKKIKKPTVETLDLGGYVLTHYLDNKRYEYVKARAVAGHWSAIWGDRSPIMAFILNAWSNDEAELLKTYLTLVYQVSNMIPDGEMIVEWLKLIHNWIQRNQQDLPDLTDDEELALRHKVNVQQDLRDPDKREVMFNEAIAELEQIQAEIKARQAQEAEAIAEAQPTEVNDVEPASENE